MNKTALDLFVHIVTKKINIFQQRFIHACSSSWKFHRYKRDGGRQKRLKAVVRIFTPTSERKTKYIYRFHEILIRSSKLLLRANLSNMINTDNLKELPRVYRPSLAE